jgi:hypothetical protein
MVNILVLRNELPSYVIWLNFGRSRRSSWGVDRSWRSKGTVSVSVAGHVYNISAMTRRRKREETCWNLLFVIFRYSVIYMLLTNKGEGDDGIDEAIEAIESEEE